MNDPRGEQPSQTPEERPSERAADSDSTSAAARTRELERAAEALRGSQRQLAAILDSVNAAVISVDERFRIVLFNKAAEATFQRSAAEMLGQPVDVLMPVRFRATHEALMRGFRDRGETVQPHGVERELPGLRANGEEFPMQASVASIEVNGSKLMTVILKDLSQVMELQREQRARILAETANAAKSKFLSQLSHELRTPLNAVIGFAQLLEEPEVANDPERVRRFGALIRTSGQHQLSMVSDLLDMTRIELGQTPLALRPLTLRPVLQSCVEMLSHAAARANVMVRGLEDIDPALSAQADEGRLRQVVANLLSNAIKYNRSGGEVRLSAWDGQDAWVHVQVQDNGVGMDADQMRHLFVPFNRLGREQSTTEGFGLGLSLSRTLVEAMGGRIEVQSEPEQGSAFCVLLPRPLGDPHPAPN